MTLRAFVSGVLLVGFVLIGAAGIAWAAGASYSDNVPETTTTPSVTVTQNVTGTTSVDTPEYALEVYDNETVRNESGTNLVEGDDYEWYSSNSTLYWYSTNSTTDGADANLTYAYSAKIADGRATKAVVDPIIEIVLPAGLLLITGSAVVGIAIGIRKGSSGSLKSRGR